MFTHRIITQKSRYYDYKESMTKIYNKDIVNNYTKKNVLTFRLLLLLFIINRVNCPLKEQD